MVEMVLSWLVIRNSGIDIEKSLGEISEIGEIKAFHLTFVPEIGFKREIK